MWIRTHKVGPSRLVCPRRQEPSSTTGRGSLPSRIWRWTRTHSWGPSSTMEEGRLSSKQCGLHTRPPQDQWNLHACRHQTLLVGIRMDRKAGASRFHSTSTSLPPFSFKSRTSRSSCASGVRKKLFGRTRSVALAAEPLRALVQGGPSRAYDGPSANHVKSVLTNRMHDAGCLNFEAEACSDGNVPAFAVPSRFSSILRRTILRFDSVPMQRHAEVPALFLETVRRTSAHLFGSLWEARQVQPRCQHVRTAISLYVDSTGSAVVPTCSYRYLLKSRAQQVQPWNRQ